MRRRVLVTDAGRGSAIAVIRSLGRRGWGVVAADHDRRSPGFRSRYVDDRVLYPRPDADPAGVAEAIIEAARNRAVDLVIPVTDEVLLPLVMVRDRLPATTKLAAPESVALAVTTDKIRTLELADRLAVPRPRSVVVATAEEARRHSAEIGWPIVLKPRTSHVVRSGERTRTFHVAYAASPRELDLVMGQLEGRTDVLLQAYVAGEGHGVELLLDRGQPLAAFQHRRLREVPLTGGASSFRESVALDPTLYGHAVQLLGALDWTGLAMVEFKVGPGGPWLMEINGRIWGSLPLALASGMDFPARLADLCILGPPPPGTPPATTYQVGVRSRNLELEVVWVGAVLRGARNDLGGQRLPRRSSFSVAARLLDPRGGYDILCRGDLAPGLAEIRKIVTKLPTKLRNSRGAGR